MKEEVKEMVKEVDAPGTIKFSTFTLALGPGAPQGAVALWEAEQSFSEKYSEYEVLVSQVVAAAETHVQLFFMLKKK